MNPETETAKTNPTHETKKKGWLRRWLKISAILTGGLVLLMTLVIYLIPTGWIKDIIRSQVKSQTGRECSIGDVQLSIFGRVSVFDFRIHEPGTTKKNLLSAQTLELTIRLMELLKKKLVINSLLLDNTRVTIIRNKDGTFNFTDILDRFTRSRPPQSSPRFCAGQAGGSGFIFRMNSGIISNSTVRFYDRAANIQADLALKHIHLSFSDINRMIQISGTVFPATTKTIGKLRFSGNLDLLEHNAFAPGNSELKLNISAVDIPEILRSAGLKNTVNLPDGKAKADINLVMKGMKLDTVLSASIQSVKLQHTALSQKPVAVPDLKIDLDATADLEKMTGNIQKLSLESSLFKSTLQANGSTELSAPATVAASLTADLKEILTFLPREKQFDYLPRNLQGQLTLNTTLKNGPSGLTSEILLTSSGLRIPDGLAVPSADLNVSGRFAYESEKDTVRINELNVDTTLASLKAAGNATGLFSDSPLTASVKLTARTRLETVCETLQIMPITGEPKLTADLTWSETRPDRVYVNSHLQCPALHTPILAFLNIKKPFTGTTLTANLSYALSSGTASFQKLALRSQLLDLDGNGSITLDKETAAALTYDARIKTDKIKDISKGAIPGFLDRIRCTGQADFQKNRLTLQKTSIRSKLKGKKGTYPFVLLHDLSVDMVKGNTFSITKTSLDINDTLGLTINGKGTNLLETDQTTGTFSVKAHGTTGKIKDMAADVLPVIPIVCAMVPVPETLPASADFTIGGHISKTASVLKTDFVVKLKNLLVASGKQKIKEPQADIRTALTYNLKDSAVDISTFTLSTKSTDIRANGALSLRLNKNSGYEIKKNTLIRTQLNLAKLKPLLPPGTDLKTTGSITAEIRPSGGMTNPSVRLSGTLQKFKGMGNDFPFAPVILPKCSFSADTAVAMGKTLESVHIRNLKIIGGGIDLRLKGKARMKKTPWKTREFYFDKGTALTGTTDLMRASKSFPALIPKKWTLKGETTVHTDVSGWLSAVTLKLRADLKKFQLATKDIGPRPLVLPDTQLTLNTTYRMGTARKTKPALEVTQLQAASSLGTLSASGICRKLDFDKNIIRFGKGSAFKLNAKLNGKNLKQTIPAAILPIPAEADFNNLGASGTLAAEHFNYAKFGQTGQNDPYLIFKSIQLSKGKLTLDSMDYGKYPIRNLNAGLRIDKGVFYLSNARLQVWGDIMADGNIDFNHAKPRARFVKASVSDLPLGKALKTQTRYGKFLSGSFTSPNPNRKDAQIVTWQGLEYEDFVKTLTVTNGSLVAKDCMIKNSFLSKGLVKINDTVNSVLSKVGGNQQRFPAVPALTRAKTITGRYSVKNGLIRVNDLYVQGTNIPDYYADGTLSIDGKINLKLYCAGDIIRHFPVKLIANSLVSRFTSPAATRKFSSTLSKSLRKKSREKKLFFELKGSASSPSVKADKLSAVLLKEIGKAVGLAVLEDQKSKITDKLGDQGKKVIKDIIKKDDKKNLDIDKKKKDIEDKVNDLFKKLF